MQKRWKVAFFLLGIICSLCCGCVPALAQSEAASPVAFVANPHSKSPTVIQYQEVKGQKYLFLPSSADLSALRLNIVVKSDMKAAVASIENPEVRLPIEDGQPFDLLSLFPDGPVNDRYPIILFGMEGFPEDGRVELIVMRSAHIGAIYLTSDVSERNREWVDNVKRHAEGTTAQMAFLGEDGGIVYDGALEEIRGRGNTTWEWGQKKPYQIKLARKTNLLDNGNLEDRNRVWLLLAEALDSTLLHNTITLDLGQEVGLFGTPGLRHVDLYYDGEYRGYYLVCEKVQVNPGRVDILDYGKYIEKLYANKLVVLDTFPTTVGINQYGYSYRYVDGIQVGLRDKGAYLIEMDMFGYSKEKSWFTASDGKYYVVRNPKYASGPDVDYLSCFMQEVIDTIGNRGVHPVTRKSIDEYLDLPSMARYLLVNEFAKTCDIWKSSTYFYIPEGVQKLYAGPLWDFDLAYACRDIGPFESGPDGYLPESGWLRDLMTLPVFQEIVKDIYISEFEPLLSGILLGGDSAIHGKALLSFEGYCSKIEASRKMNYVVWSYRGEYSTSENEGLAVWYDSELDYLHRYLEERTEWLTGDIGQWSGSTIKNLNLTFSYQNANILEHATMRVNSPYSNATLTNLEWSTEVVETEPYHTLYSATITLVANEGSVFFPDLTVCINGYAVEILSLDEKRVVAAFCFQGPTFVPAIYDGVDYALIYNYDYFLAVNPEVIDECGDIPEDVLEYYVNYGIGDGLRAIETFDPETFIDNNQKKMERYYMCDVEMCTLYYLENCYAEDLMGMDEAVLPAPAE